ncbi:MAG: O-antigen ligase family protein [Lachnospiraceae bacterium]|nr:O-antigen ligase family protein [Lachnospiraceae bacterium]
MKASNCKTSLIKSNNKGGFRISGEKIFLYFSLIFAFEPKLFVKYSVLNYIYIFGLIFVFLVNIYLYFRTQDKLSPLLVVLLLYRLSFGIPTIINGGDIALWGYLSIVLISLYITIEIYAKKNFKLLLNCLINVLTVILVINIIIVFLFPSGIVDGIFFIGIRTRFTEVILVDVILALTFDKLYNKKISKKSLFIIILSIITTFKVWIATAIIGLVFLFAIVIIFSKKTLRPKIFLIGLVSLLILNILIVHVRIVDYFDWLLVDILGKSTSLSGRTGIWDNAIPIIFKRPLFGYGLADNGNFVPWVWGIGEIELWQAHNQWLQMLYDGGIVCVFFFVLLTVISYRRIKGNNDLIIKGKYLFFGILAFYLMMIVEIFSYTPYFFVLPFILYNLRYSTKN